MTAISVCRILGLSVALTGVLLEGASGSELLPNAQQVFLGSNGVPLAAGFVFTYVPGTTTPKTTWQNQGLTVANSNPVVLDANGQARIWAASGQSYRQVVLDSNSSLVWDQVTVSPGDLAGTSCTTGHVVTWTSGGSSLGCDPAVSVILNNLDIQEANGPTIDSSSPNYFPQYSQLAGTRIAQSLSGALSDSNGSFRDALFVTSTDQDQTVYNFQHTNYSGRFNTYGPNTGGSYLVGEKNYIGMNATCHANNSGHLQLGVASGCAAITADTFQYGEGIGDNEIATHQVSAADGSTAQSKSLAGLQVILNTNFADDDTTHTAYGLLVSSVGTKRITAGLGFSGGSGTARNMIQSNALPVTEAGIVMPASSPAGNYAGTIIDYGHWNGLVASFTGWRGDLRGGAYWWLDSGVFVGSLDTAGFRIENSGTLAGATALATTAVGPFLGLTAMAGPPTGVPTVAGGGTVPCVYDSTNEKIWCYSDAVWRGVVLAP